MPTHRDVSALDASPRPARKWRRWNRPTLVETTVYRRTLRTFPPIGKPSHQRLDASVNSVVEECRPGGASESSAAGLGGWPSWCPGCGSKEATASTAKWVRATLTATHCGFYRAGASQGVGANRIRCAGRRSSGVSRPGHRRSDRRECTPSRTPIGGTSRPTAEKAYPSSSRVTYPLGRLTSPLGVRRTKLLPFRAFEGLLSRGSGVRFPPGAPPSFRARCVSWDCRGAAGQGRFVVPEPHIKIAAGRGPELPVSQTTAGRPRRTRRPGACPRRGALPGAPAREPRDQRRR